MQLIKLTEPRIINTEEEAKQLQDELFEADVVAVDTETDGGAIKLKTSPVYRDRLYCWTVSWSEDTRILIDRNGMFTCKDWLESNRPKIFHNSKYDMHVFANHGIIIGGPIFDTMVMDFMVDENREGRHGLKPCSLDYLGLHLAEFTEVFGKQADVRKYPLAHLADYATKDAVATFMLFVKLKSLMEEIKWEDGTYWDYYEQYEAPFTKILWNMERRGIGIDKGYLKDISVRIEEEMIKVASEFNKFAGRPINIRSNDQLSSFLFNSPHVVNPMDRGLGLPIIDMTKGGTSSAPKPSVDEAVIKKLSDMGFEGAKIVLRYRSLSKIIGTYVTPFLGKHTEMDAEHRVHTKLNQHIAVTGRLSSGEPNLQNVPRPGEDEFKIRSAFIPGNGRVLICADYKQIEMRLMAHFSKDPTMISAINDGLDTHCFTASLMFGIPYENMIGAVTAKDAGTATPEQKELLKKRQAAKTIGFGIIYGRGPRALSEELKLYKDEYNPETKQMEKVLNVMMGQDYINRYFNAYPTLKSYMEQVKWECEVQGFVRTLLGRYRRIFIPPAKYIEGDRGPYEDRKTRGDRERGFRQAINLIPQGSTADIIKLAMLELDYTRNSYMRELDCKMLLQVHDELVFESLEETADEAMEHIKEVMENILPEPLAVATPVDIHKAYCWSEAH